MKTVERKLNKAQLVTVWLLIISLLLGAAYVAVLLISKKLADKNETDTSSPILDLREGEATYLNQVIAYPTIEEGAITFIEISSEKNGKFGVSRAMGENNSFIFHYYVDGEEKAVPYIPPILSAEGALSYESLYAIENGDGYGMIPYLTYLCVAIGTPYVTERIDLPEDTDTRNAMLRDYGITKSETTSVSFAYNYKNAQTGEIEEGVHVINIGKKALSGTGYYFMVDGRDYVYYTNSEYFSYALAGFNEFIKGMLVSEGISSDSVYGPYLTTDFKKWTTTQYKKESDVVFIGGDADHKDFESPTVVTKGNYIASVDKGLSFVPESSDFNGYEAEKGKTLSFDLQAMLGVHPDSERIKNALVGKNVGKYYEVTEEGVVVKDEKIIFTLLTELYDSDEKKLDLSENADTSYSYSVSKIEAVVNDNGELTGGTVGAGDTLLKVTYRYTVGGQTVNYDCHALLDLTTVGDDIAALFLGKVIGEDLDANVDFTISYNKENALTSNEKYVITAINSIYKLDNAGTGALSDDTVKSDSYVTISYYREFAGRKSDVKTTMVKLDDIKETDKLAPLKDIILGKKVGACEAVVYNDVFYYEVMREFVTYEIEEIEYFVANEIVVSFSFCNPSQRDPFYGDTFYKNTLKNQNALYGLNSGSCETAVKLLGGIGTDSSSAVGLSGVTVAIGLTLDNMEKYELYAHKIYFEMPRLIEDATEEENADSDELSDYKWARTLGFTLYFSNPVYDADGSRIRYVGSDMYDIVAKVPADDFDFLEYDFVDFWARKNILMMDVEKLEGLKLEFNMSDLAGTYDFDVEFKDMHGGYINGDYVMRDEAFSGSTSLKNAQFVNVTASSDAFDTAFKQMFGTETGNLASLYNVTMGDGTLTLYPGSSATLGASYFNSVYETLQLTRYLDALSEEERASAPEGEPILRMTFDVADKEYDYTYEFYRIDDRRIRVRLFRSLDGVKVESFGEVSDYYITVFAFKKVINNYINILNGQPVDSTIGYPTVN